MVKKNNNEMNPLVATVLIILITVAAVTIIWAAIIPMIKDTLPYKYNIKYENCSEQFVNLPEGTRLVGYTEGEFESDFEIKYTVDLLDTKIKFRFETTVCDILESNKVIAQKSVDPFGNEFYPGKFKNEITAEWLDEYCECYYGCMKVDNECLEGCEVECPDCLKFTCGNYTVEAYK